MGRDLKADLFVFIGSWALFFLLLLLIDFAGKLNAEPRIFWLYFFPSIAAGLMVLRHKVRQSFNEQKNKEADK